MLTTISIILAVVVIMEGLTWAFHRYVMHGPGWRLHRSHHNPHSGKHFELNDFYAIFFGALAVVLFYFGWIEDGIWWLYPIGIGVSVYGVLYFIVHDVLTHRRVPIAWMPKSRYIGRLIAAHHLHHVTKGRDGGVAFGFLYTPPVELLRKRLRAQKSQSAATERRSD